MDSSEVNRLARRVGVQGWRGVVSADHVPRGMRVGEVCVVNCCAADRPGQHWLALHRATAASWELFDSSGSHPSAWVQLQVPPWWGPECSYSAERLQHPAADTCGLYAVLYCLDRWTMSMPAILANMLHSQTRPSLNDHAIVTRTLTLLHTH